MIDQTPEDIIPENIARQYIYLHNLGVETEDFSAMLGLFAGDAQMIFKNISTGPFYGRDSIREAFAVNPPQDKLRIFRIERLDEDIEVEYGWQINPDEKMGSIIFTFSDSLIKSITII